MSPALNTLIACLAAYLLGSISFAVISAKLFKLADPRTYGSGNPGATNVLRSGNKKAALFTLLGDALKGTAAVLIARALELPEQTVGLVALAVFLGHLYPVFLKFKGGKGVATAAGVLLALAPLVGIATLATWIFTALLSRYSSLAAIVAAVLAPAYAMLFDGADGFTGVILAISLALVFKHFINIQRLFAGQETKIGAKKKA